MRASESATVQHTLSRPDVHRRWISEYYGAEDPLYEALFDHIVDRLAPPERTTFLDAGCGDGTHAARLARRGYHVVALDFSEYVLGEARQKIGAEGLARMIRFEHGSLLQLPFANDAFEQVLCWGVLMHIPDVETAISELARVVKPNGCLIVSEGNMWSIESMIVRVARRLLGGSVVKWLQGKSPAELRITAAGAEYWRQTDAGPLICREARIPWLIAKFASHGFVLRERVSGAFIERSTWIQTGWLRRWMQKFNLAWFRHMRLPRPATANLLLLQKVRRECESAPLSS